MTNTRRLIIPAVCALFVNLAEFRATDLFAADLPVSEQKLALDKLPADVLKTIKTKYPAAELVEAEEEIEDGETEYAVTLKVSGKEIELTLSATGEIESIEREIAAADLPKSINETLQTKYPSSTIIKAEAEFEVEDGKEEIEEYEVTIETADKETVELKFDSQGRLKEEKRSYEDDDEFTNDFSLEKPDLVSTGTNPFFVLEPGYQLVLEGKGEQLTITVLNETKVVEGVETRIVEERETKNGKLVEVSRNFFAISKRTNSVYYFGEEVDDYKDGKITGHDGSWLSGVNNARFGLMMPGFPLLEAKFQQEFAPGTAMDRAEIESVDASISVPAGNFQKCLVVEESTPLEPGKKELKKYAPHVGLIVDGDLKLVRYGKK